MVIAPLPNSPCVFTFSILHDHPPLFIGLYVDDFVYFNQSPSIQAVFCHQLTLAHHMLVEIANTPTHFIGHKIETIIHSTGQINVHLSQKANIDALIAYINPPPFTSSHQMPYHSKYAVDKVP